MKTKVRFMETAFGKVEYIDLPIHRIGGSLRPLV